MRYTGAQPLQQWLRFSGRYIAAISVGHLVWEMLQLPLYTIWWERSVGEIAFALGHCTAGDLLIGTTAFAVAVLLSGRSHGPNNLKTYARVAVLTVMIAVGYTLFSEWYNTRVAQGWSYSTFMPLVPPFDIGLSPLLQWIIVPGLALWWLKPRDAALGAHPPSAPFSETR